MKKMIKTNIVVKGDITEKLLQISNDYVDLTITSPPYNKRHNIRGWLVSKDNYSDFDDHMPEEKYQEWQLNVINEIYRITKPGGSLFYNHKHRWNNGILINPLQWIGQSKWVLRQEIVWDRAIAANMRGWRYWQVDERIYWLYKPVNNNLIGVELESRHAKFSSIWKIKPEPRINQHPAPFPIEIPTRIIYSVLVQKGIVFDPFCGTGTTLVAAKNLGHDYFGIDLSQIYVKYARNRLKKDSGDISRMRLEIAKHKIDESFAARKEKGTEKWPFGPKNGNGLK